jgi:O-acetyl-ADP-ribose deacetylase (regulator of RNase III)
MPPRIVFADKNTEFITRVSELFADCPNVSATLVECIKEIPQDKAVFVSPANSLGFMDGGIDYVYSRTMFPGVEQRVREKIKSLGIVSGLGRNYLPVGSAIMVPAGTSSYLISCPTMFLPHNVANTQNAFYAFSAVLGLFAKSGASESYTLVCPALCTGVGRMDVHVAATQMHNAYVDFCESQRVPVQIRFQDDPCVFLTQSRDSEQPINYDNREIRPDMSVMSYIDAVKKK